MAKTKLTSTIVKTHNISDVEITAVVVNYEESFTEIHYITFQDDGTPYQRGRVRLADVGTLNPQPLYAQVLAKIEADELAPEPETPVE